MYDKTQDEYDDERDHEDIPVEPTETIVIHWYEHDDTYEIMTYGDPVLYDGRVPASEAREWLRAHVLEDRYTRVAPEQEKSITEDSEASYTSMPSIDELKASMLPRALLEQLDTLSRQVLELAKIVEQLKNAGQQPNTLPSPPPWWQQPQPPWWQNPVTIGTDTGTSTTGSELKWVYNEEDGTYHGYPVGDDE